MNKRIVSILLTLCVIFGVFAGTVFADIEKEAPMLAEQVAAGTLPEDIIANSLDHFLGNVIIIENAADLSDAQLGDFAKILDRDDRSLLCVFTDTKRRVSELLKRVPALLESFTAVFEGRDYTPRELVSVAADYLLSQDARLSQDAEMFVLGEAQKILVEKRGAYARYIEDLAALALEKAEKGGFLGFGSGKLDRDDRLIVDEKHFRRALKEMPAPEDDGPEKAEEGETEV